MSVASSGNLLVLQAGGPTPVLNTSLFGVLDEASRHRGDIPKILAARDGMQGLSRGEFLDLTVGWAQPTTPEERWAVPTLLKRTPGASLGSSRYKPTDENLPQIIAHLRRHRVRWLLLIGGNGTMRAAASIARAAEQHAFELGVIAIPKTIDNDLVGTDRCPGYASAARYVAQSVRDLGMDVRGLPQPVSIFETMGRSAGWLAAASALAKMDDQHAPHLVYLPERPFVLDEFLTDIDRVVRRLGWCVAVVSEGIRADDGRPIFESGEISQSDALSRPLVGDVAAHLASIASQRLKTRCRSEKPGLCGRASMLHVAAQDLVDAELVGRAAVRAAIAGHSSRMIALTPLTAGGERWTLVPLDEVIVSERTFPPDWLGGDAATAVTPAFVEYVRPLVGPLVDYAVPLKDRLPLISEGEK